MDSRRTIPLHEEVLSVGKKAVETSTVRVETHVHAREQTVEQELDSTTVDIVRVPVGRVVETAPEVRQDGDVLIVPVLEEELVVTKRLILKEEVHITRRVSRRTEQISATLRTEEASVTRDGMLERSDQPSEE
ncbi:YsnF/AvaK domain-containing protein [Indioceanicola profundi]|uniref:YsnF/AvaK domain-containing protein n=1 Tax=Indioceanicola profundi TaxID=2220096 RepID=UPI000E6AB819|nr:YsnF/AvaK domain-containing protein [Indioceanicola profundi]